MVDTNPASDRYFDLSLRLLTTFVLFSLACCVAFLAYRWSEPWRTKKDQIQNESHAVPAAVAPPAKVVSPAPADVILMDPHKTFQCTKQGHPSFSDRACDSDTGSEQILPLNSIQATPPTVPTTVAPTVAPSAAPTAPPTAPQAGATH